MKIPRWMIEFTGHTMLHNRPPWFVYRPDIHKVRGADVRRILDTVEPGDILLRRFDGYLNTIFTPGFWGHAGLFVGNNQIVHAVSQGTISEDILNFCRADAVCVFSVVNLTHPKPQIRLAVDRAIAAADENIDYDFDFSGLNETYYCTELIDVVYGYLFAQDYVKKFGQLILMPDGIYKSKQVSIKLEIRP